MPIAKANLAVLGTPKTSSTRKTYPSLPEDDETKKTDRPTITDATIKAYRDAAKKVWHDGGQIEIDDCAEISRGSDSGAYVQAWVWVYNDQLEPEPGPTSNIVGNTERR